MHYLFLFLIGLFFCAADTHASPTYSGGSQSGGNGKSFPECEKAAEFREISAFEAQVTNIQKRQEDLLEFLKKNGETCGREGASATVRAYACKSFSGTPEKVESELEQAYASGQSKATQLANLIHQLDYDECAQALTAKIPELRKSLQESSRDVRVRCQCLSGNVP